MAHGVKKRLRIQVFLCFGHDDFAAGRPTRYAVDIRVLIVVLTLFI